MSDLTSNIANSAARKDSYALTVVNESNDPWFFYVYQTMPSQPLEMFSLAWFASPYTMYPGRSITFRWETDYSFVWAYIGDISPGKVFTSSQIVPCSPTGPNKSTFSVNNNTPNLSSPVTGGQAGSLTVIEDSSVPNITFATGIGMYRAGTFVQQSTTNTTQVYTPTPKYWIAAATSMQAGTVLGQMISQTAEVSFPPGVFDMSARFNQNKVWTVSDSNFY